MKKTELKNSEAKKITLKNSKGSAEHFLNELNRETGPEKTQEHRNSQTGLTQEETQERYKNYATHQQKGEEAEIIHEMDEIIKNNDKFETIRVIMEILCKELEISKESQFPKIAGAVQGVVERYYKSMEDWKNLRNQSKSK